MRTSISKKLLAGALSVMMVLSLFAGVPANKAQAAASVKVTGKTAVYTGTTNTYKVVNLKKAQYVKVSVTGDAKKLVTVKKGGKKLATTKKVYGGKTITLKVANKKAAGKKYTLVVKAYKKGATKPFKTIKKTVTVYSKTTSVTLDQTEATLKVGETVTLTATKKPAKNTKAIKWTSSDETVATVKNGVVTAVAAGTATIKATSGAKSATATITVEKAEEEEKAAELVSVEATGSKQLTATLSAKAEVKAEDFTIKGTASSPKVAEVKADEADATKIIITLGSKMLAGTYTITYKEVSKEVVVKDETLTTLAPIGTVLAETKKATGANEASIGYQALNQYGERMLLPGSLVVSCSFGKAEETRVATASKDGIITVTGISDILAIEGTKGTLTLTDNKTGVNSSTEITYGAPATLAKIEVVGIYDVSAGEYVETIPALKDGSNYKLVIKATNQYDQEMDAETIVKDRKTVNATTTANNTITAAQIQTNLNIPAAPGNVIDDTNVETVTVKGTEYPAFTLTSGGSPLTAGKLNIIVVNATKGMVLSTDVTVSERNLIKSMSFSAQDQITFGDKNELNYNIIGTDGKEITKYTDLKALVTLPNTDFEWVEQSDKTAKLFFTPSVGGSVAAAPTGKDSTIASVTFTGNQNYAQYILIEVKQFTVYAMRQPTTITKYTGQTAFIAGEKKTLDKSKFVIEDQYGTKMSAGMVNYDAITNADIQAILVDPANCFAVSNKDVATRLNVIAPVVKDENKLTANATMGDATLYVTIKQAPAIDKNTNYQLKVKLSVVDSQDAANLKIKSVNKGYVVKVAAGAKSSGLTDSKIAVIGYVAGKEVTLPSTQYSITKDTFVPIEEKEGKVSKTATVEVTVETTVDGKKVSTVLSKEYTYSNEDAKMIALLSYADATDDIERQPMSTSSVNTEAKFTAERINEVFYTLNQYGGVANVANADKVSYHVVLSDLSGHNDVSSGKVYVKNNDQLKPEIIGAVNTVANATITAKCGEFTASQDLELSFVTVAGSERTNIETAIDGVIAANGSAAQEVFEKALEEAIKGLSTSEQAYIRDYSINDDGTKLTVYYTDGTYSEKDITLEMYAATTDATKITALKGMITGSLLSDEYATLEAAKKALKDAFEKTGYQDVIAAYTDKDADTVTVLFVDGDKADADFTAITTVYQAQLEGLTCLTAAELVNANNSGTAVNWVNASTYTKDTYLAALKNNAEKDVQAVLASANVNVTLKEGTEFNTTSGGKNTVVVTVTLGNASRTVEVELTNNTYA